MLYDPEINAALQTVANEEGIALTSGTYAAFTGPSYETPAEIRALRTLGADAVGMSTALEVEAALSRGLTCAAISCITNQAAGLAPGAISHEEVLATSAAAAERVGRLLEELLRREDRPS
jgi:purine-nucleoside phosphorylase